MFSPLAVLPASGTTPRYWITSAPSPSRRRATAPATPVRPAPARHPSAFERLEQILRSNDHLLNEQQLLIQRLREARAYLATPDGHSRLAAVNLAHLKLKYSGVLARLRANRLEARAIFAALDPGCGGTCHA